MLTARIRFLVREGFEPARSTFDLRWGMMIGRIRDWDGSECKVVRGGNHPPRSDPGWESDQADSEDFLVTQTPDLRPSTEEREPYHWFSGPHETPPEREQETWFDTMKSWLAGSHEPDLWVLEGDDQRRERGREEIFPPGVDTRSFSPDPRIRRIPRLMLTLKYPSEEFLDAGAFHVVPVSSDQGHSSGSEPRWKHVDHRRRLFQQAGGFWIGTPEPYSSRLALEAGASGCPIVVAGDRLPRVELYVGKSCWRREELTPGELAEMNRREDSRLQERIRRARTQLRRHHEWEHITDRLIQRFRARL